MSTAPILKTLIPVSVEILRGPHSGTTMDFSKESIFIGRGNENDLTLAQDGKISRKHVEIRQNQGEITILNLSDKNQVLVAGQEIQSLKITGPTNFWIGDTELRVIPKIAKLNPVPSQTRGPAVVTSVPLQKTQTQSIQQWNPKPLPSISTAQPKFSNNSRPPTPASSSNSRLQFYVIVGIIGVLVYFFLFSGKKKVVVDELPFRSSDKIQNDMNEADEALKKLQDKRERFDSLNYKRAQENFIKGFRDFRQGKYDRARESFRVVLSFDPENELAKRYYHLSGVKFDEELKRNLANGYRYRENRNFRMCQSSFFVVMTMLQNNQANPTYAEAKKFYEQCKLAQEGRF